MESKIKARNVLNSNYKQIMSAFSSIYTQLEFGETSSEEKTPFLAAYYTVVFFNAKSIPPIVSHIDLHMSKNSHLTLTVEDKELAAEILVENHIHELKLEGFINVEMTENGLTQISLTEKGMEQSKLLGKDVRLL